MSETHVRLEFEGAFATITVDRPKALNALNTRTLEELERAAAQCATREGLRGVIVTGAGDKAFVAGADIAEMQGMDPLRARHFGTLGQRVMDAIAALPLPVLAAANGFALGGGCELALACDCIYASENARFGLPEVGLGIIPGFGGTQRLARLVGPARAKELIFGGEMIDAAKAKEIGLALEVLPLPQLIPHCRRVLERIGKRGPLAVQRAKEAIDRGLDLELADGIRVEREVFTDLFESADRGEGMTAFLEKRPPVFTGR
jgi:enoyl-CoA hydratase